MPDKLESKKFIKSIKSKVIDFWEKNETRVVTLIGLILVAAIAFEIGVLQGQKWQQKPLVIEKTAQAITCPTEAEKTAQGPNLSSSEPSAIPVKECAYVGSKNSDKYHLPNCQWAKRIKPENVVCFKSVEDAAAKSYQPDKNCIK